jgi:hypothetical protein
MKITPHFQGIPRNINPFSHPIFKGQEVAASSFNSDVKASIDRGLASFLDQYLQRRIDESK